MTFKHSVISILLLLIISLGIATEFESNDLKEMAKLFKEDVKHSSNNTYEDYLSSRDKGPVTITSRNVYPANLNRSTKSVAKIYVISELNLYTQVGPYVTRYIQDIQSVYGCEIVSQQVSSSISGADLKILIINENNLSVLDGVVLIGDLPSGWFEIEDDFNMYGYKDFPCDLYLMDMNGTWTDSDQNGKYELHTGEVNPEIFLGRISTANMGTLVEEIQGMIDYLDKNHDFWSGVTVVNQLKGLTYTDEDWTPYYDITDDIQYLYGSNYDVITYGDTYFSKADYLDRLNSETYEFVQLACHSAWYYHAMSGGNIFTSEIFDIPPKSIAYNLFCCSGCRWTDAGPTSTGFLGGAYVYNSSSKALVATGSSKTGSMLGFSYFYAPLLSEKVFGTALKEWWLDYVGATHDFDETCWFYGMSIIGDPMIDPMYEVPIFLAPQNIVISANGNNFDLFWDAEPHAITYSVYSSEDPEAEFSSWTLEVSGVTGTNWTDTNAGGSKKFYVIVAVNSL